MSGDGAGDGKGEPRTVFQPGGDPGKDVPDEPRTVFEPARADAPGEPRTVFAAGPAAAAPATSGTPAAGIRPGDVLNHMFAVRRLIARGGMGEVFEGANLVNDERVAIKVMLPALAQDPNVITLFRREAQTLTRLRDEAVVQYRVVAQEPTLGVLYIVTEYSDGTNLADALGRLSRARRSWPHCCAGLLPASRRRTGWERSTATFRRTTCCWAAATLPARS